VKAAVNVVQIFAVQMGVDLCGGDIGVPEELLYDGEIRAPLQEMRREGMPQGVG
jgi:hypothetical protein